MLFVSLLLYFYQGAQFCLFSKPGGSILVTPLGGQSCGPHYDKHYVYYPLHFRREQYWDLVNDTVWAW